MKYDGYATTDWVEDARREIRLRQSTDPANSGSVRKVFGLTNSSPGILVRFADFLDLTWNMAQSWLALALTGVIVGTIAVAINIVTVWLISLREGHCSKGFYLSKEACCMGVPNRCPDWEPWTSLALFQYFIYLASAVFFAVAACLLVMDYAPLSSGSGISEIKCIVAGFQLKGFLDSNTLLIKCLSLPLVIASGFNVGKEGPSVHYATCVGEQVAHLFPHVSRHRAKRRELHIACTAAGVAVAFGSPIGGVLFSLEEITPQCELVNIWRSYFCCLVATGVFTLFDPFKTGQIILFAVKHDRPWRLFELPFFVVLGLFGGYVGQFIIHYNLRVQAARKWFWQDYCLQEVFLIALITAILSYFSPFLRIDMTKSIEMLFEECEKDSTEWICRGNQGAIALALLLALIIRIPLVLVSYGARIPAGIFVPSLAIGALFGRFLGTIASSLQETFPGSWLFGSCTDAPCINPGAYALLGAGALLSGVMNITVTVVIIMFELTGDLNYIVPSMVTVGVVKLVASARGRGGIADRAIVMNGLPLLGEEIPSMDVTVDSVMSKPISITIDAPYPQNPVHGTYPVVDAYGKLLGTAETELLRERPIQEILNTSPLVVSPKTPLHWVRELFVNLGPRAVLIVEYDRLVGILTRKDLLRYMVDEKVEPTELENRLATAYADILKRLWPAHKLESIVNG